MNDGRDPTRPRVGEVEDRPEIAETVLDRRARQRQSCAGVDAPKLLRGLAGRVLDRLRFIEHDRAPGRGDESVHVAHRRRVRGDDHVGAGDLGLELVGRGARRAVVHDDPQSWCEACSFSRPVTDDRGRRDHQGPAVTGRPGKMGKDGRRLAKPHVECETPAEAGRVEEPDPGDRFGLIGAQGAGEAVRLGDRRHRHLAGTSNDVVGPTVAVDDDTAGERRPTETDRLAQDLRPGELRHTLALGERNRCLLHIESIDLDPLATRLHERTRLARESSNVVSGQLDIVEQDRPGDVAELVRPDGRACRRLREQSQRRSRLAP